jgi:hypothetical protein
VCTDLKMLKFKVPIIFSAHRVFWRAGMDINKCRALMHVTPVDFSEFLGLAPVTRLLYP